MRWGIVSLYIGESGKQGVYNSQEIGLARAMSHRGYECFVFIPCTDAHVREERAEDGIEMIYVPSKVIGINARYDWSILSEYRIDVAQINSDNRIFAYRVIRYCDRHGILCYTYFGTMESDSRSTFKRLLMKGLMMRNVAEMKTHKNFAKTCRIARQAKCLGINDVEVASVGLDLSAIPDEDEKLRINRGGYGIPAAKKLILFVGRIDEYKHPMEALDVITELDGGYHLVVIGTGELNERFGAEIRKRRLADRVTWIKQIPNADIHRFYKAAEYMINLNPYEIFGMSVLEAMYQGCNVIAMHAPGPDEIIEDGVSGFLVNDLKEMKEIIVSGRKLSSDVVRKRILENFTWDNTTKKIDSWIREAYLDPKDQTARMKEKPTVLIIHNRYRQRGGEDTVVENEIQLLEKHGHRVYLYERDNSEKFLPFSVFFNLKSYIDVKVIIRKQHVDIVHVHNTWMVVSPSVFYAAVSMGVPVVQTLHNFRMICPSAILYRKGRVCEECVKYGMQRAVKFGCYRGSKLFSFVCALNNAKHRRTGIYRKINFICLSEFNKKKILQINSRRTMRIDPSKVWVKPNFIWERGKSLNNWRDRKGFIFAGRLTEEKGIKVLFKAWALMGNDAPGLFVYGNGGLKEWCEKVIEKRGLKISMLGEVDHDTLMGAMGRSTALIFPSVWYEGFPMTVIEALSVGTPVIVSDMGNEKQFIENRKNGLLFECGSARDLARAVREVSDGNIVFDEKDILIPDICTPEENYSVLMRIYENAKVENANDIKHYSKRN